QLLTLGAPRLLTQAGEQVRFRTRKHFALLIRLAVEAGRKLTRDYLMDLLWPNVAAPRARHSLAQALTVLKERVGRDALVVQRASLALGAGGVPAGMPRPEASPTRFARADARHRGQRKPGRCRSVTSGASRPNRSSDASASSHVCMTRGSACDGASRTSSPCSAILAWERPLSRTRSCRRVRWRGRRL